MWGGCQRALSGCYEVHLPGTRPARGSRWCLAAIDSHVHVVLTLRFYGGRSGGDSRSRSSGTLFEGGNVDITAVAAMGGRCRTTGWDWLRLRYGAPFPRSGDKIT